MVKHLRQSRLCGLFVLAAVAMLLFSVAGAHTAVAQDGAYRPGTNMPDDSTESYRDPNAAQDGSEEGGNSSSDGSGEGQDSSGDGSGEDESGSSSDEGSSEEEGSEEGSSDGNGSQDDQGGSEDGEGTNEDIGTGRPDGNTDTGPDENQEGEEGSGFLRDMAVNMLKAIFGWIGEGVGEAADRRTEELSSQLTEGRYMLDPPSNELTKIYDDVGNFTKPIAIVLFLWLGLSMALRGANHDTAYAAQVGIPRIVTVIAGIAFMPEIIGVVADLTREIANALVDEQAMQEGFTRLAEGERFRKQTMLSGPVGDGIFDIIKLILGVLIVLAIAIRNLVFGLLYVIGPLAIGLYGFQKFADVAGAWLRGILACFVISILWAAEFGLGFRFVADPTLLYGGTGWSALPLLFWMGILWLAWKTPWWVFQWAFYSYSAGGGGGGLRGAMQAVSLYKLFK